MFKALCTDNLAPKKEDVVLCVLFLCQEQARRKITMGTEILTC